MIYEKLIALTRSRQNGTEFYASQLGSCNHYLSRYIMRKNKKLFLKKKRIYILNYNNAL